MSLFLEMMSTGAYYHMLMEEADGDGGAGGGSGDGDDGDDGDNDGTKGIDKDKVLGAKDDGKKADNDNDDDGDKDDEKDKKGDEKPAERPEFIKEKFWDPEKGQPRLEAMAKAYDDLEKKMGNQDKAPDDYKVELDEDANKIFTDGDPEKDPILAWFKEYAKENNFTQERFDSALAGFAEKAKDLIDANTPEEIDEKAEMEKLGKNSAAIVKNQQKFLEGFYKQGHVNEGQMQELLILTETADGIKALQALRNYYGDQQRIPQNLTPSSGVKSAAELQAMQADKRYGVDDEYTAEVDAAYEAKYGKGTSGQSMQSAL